jgi:REP element-mobilizing transposase RayT
MSIHIHGNVTGSSINTGDNVRQTFREMKETSEEQLLKNDLLLARLDRTEHFNQFDHGYKNYQLCEIIEKPLVFILHGEESAQLDLITRRIRFYDVRRITNNEKIKTLCDIPKDVEIKYYPLCLNYFSYDDKKLTEMLSNAVFFNASKSIDDITEQLAREKAPIIIELNISTEHLHCICAKQRESALLNFITYWVNLKKIKQTKPLFIILSFKYQTSSFFMPNLANKAIRNVLNQVRNDNNLNNVVVLPEFGKLTKLEVTSWIKTYCSLCKENRFLSSDVVDKLFQSSKLTMKQATKQLERLLNEYCP